MNIALEYDFDSDVYIYGVDITYTVREK